MKEYVQGEIIEKAKALFSEERKITNLNGWFVAREAAMEKSEEEEPDVENRAASSLRRIVETLPIFISNNSVFAGTQRDAFARTYALINPAFKVETFNGYCDPTEVFNDVVPDENITAERIQSLKEKTANSTYVKTLSAAYQENQQFTDEVVFFFEQVTGHIIPDFRYVLAHGVEQLKEEIYHRFLKEENCKKKNNWQSMSQALDCVLILADRYRTVALEQMENSSPHRSAQLQLMADTLKQVPRHGARNLYEAIQSFMLLWQVMCLEQAPNPFALSVGNADRIFEPYRKMTNMSPEEASELFCCLLVYFNVGDRSWAISQNILVGGKDANGHDTTNETTFALLDAFFTMNLPQPILSVRLHKATPPQLYEAMGKFFFSPGVLTPSLFNDDSVFVVLKNRGVDENDAANYAVAGCQEPLIMGCDNGNTTNSWLNLGKILELIINKGCSLISGKKIIDIPASDNAKSLLQNIQETFYTTVENIGKKMATAANKATYALSFMRVPFLSVFMGGAESGWDMRDTEHIGTKYNGSGCLIHGLSVVADSFVAIDHLLQERPQDAQRLLQALQNDFADDLQLRDYLLSCPKYGNNIPEADDEAAKVASRVSDIVSSLRNNWGNAFRPDWSSPSTHLLYGYWVGALPDGRKAREMLGYGVDPLFGDAQQGLGFRTLSAFKLPYEKFTGGCASHFGVDPKYFTAPTLNEKGLQMRDRVIAPLFFNPDNCNLSPFYLYMNVTTPEILRKVLAEPEKYAPSGVYIVRIHGTFVNFLDLSPAIQQDIINRLDMPSTAIGT